MGICRFYTRIPSKLNRIIANPAEHGIRIQNYAESLYDTVMLYRKGTGTCKLEDRNAPFAQDGGDARPAPPDGAAAPAADAGAVWSCTTLRFNARETTHSGETKRTCTDAARTPQHPRLVSQSLTRQHPRWLTDRMTDTQCFLTTDGMDELGHLPLPA
jgi:hypothetical protein